jgi:hypothetical protein
MLNTFGETGKLPDVTQTQNTHFLTEVDGHFRLNHGLLFGFVQLFNLAYLPIHKEYQAAIALQSRVPKKENALPTL